LHKIYIALFNEFYLQALGVGKLRPNTLMLGYKSNWQNSDPMEMEEYVNIIE